MLPAQLRSAAAPAVLGLRLARGAVWAAAVVLSAAGLRAGCFQLADAGLLAAQRRAAFLFTSCSSGLCFGMRADLLPPRWQTLASSPRRGLLLLCSHGEREGWALPSAPARVPLCWRMLVCSLLIAVPLHAVKGNLQSTT